MDWILQRRPTAPDWMFGDLDAVEYRCVTVEDELREVKVQKETAIPAGRYELTFEDSPKFGPQTLTVKRLDGSHPRGFKYIRIHSGVSDDSTEGCLVVGDRLDLNRGEISGGKVRGVLDRLKSEALKVFASGERLFLEIRNAPGDRYVDSGNLATEA